MSADPVAPGLRVVCAWCTKVIREPDGSEPAKPTRWDGSGPPVSHGMCADCLDEQGAS